MKYLKNIFLILITVSGLYSGSLYAADTTTAADTATAAWTIAAEKFRYADTFRTDPASDTAAGDIPLLILEQIAADGQRTLPAREVFNTDQDTLLQARLALFLELSKEVKTRDALVLKYEKKRALDKAIHEENKKIAEIQEKIRTNLSDSTANEKKSLPEIEREENGLPPPPPEKTRTPLAFFNNHQLPVKTVKTIALYKGDAAELFKRPDTAAADDFTSYTVQKALADAKINGLITGSIISYGGYAAITAELHTYPGGMSAGVATEVGLLSDSLPIARRLARALMPMITNNLPIELHFAVEPPEAADGISISIDGIVFEYVPDSMPADSGIHVITVQSPGYRNESIRYSFTGNRKFNVHISLTPERSGVLQVRLAKPINGTIYTNGIDAFPVTEDEPSAPVTVNGQAVIGQFVDMDKQSMFFYIPAEIAEDKNDISIKGKPYDISADIEKHRRRMYTAYSALIISLPFSFYTYGRFLNYYNAGSLGAMDYDEAKVWQRRSWCAVSISATLGVIFTYQLIRYLISANSVLPRKASLDKQKD